MSKFTIHHVSSPNRRPLLSASPLTSDFSFTSGGLTSPPLSPVCSAKDLIQLRREALRKEKSETALAEFKDMMKLRQMTDAAEAATFNGRHWQRCKQSQKWRLKALIVETLRYHEGLRAKQQQEKCGSPGHGQQQQPEQPQLDDVLVRYSELSPDEKKQFVPLLEKQKRMKESNGDHIEELIPFTKDLVKLVMSDVDAFYIPRSLRMAGSSQKAYDTVKAQLLTMHLYKPRKSE